MWFLKSPSYLCVLILPIFLSHGFDHGWKCESEEDCTTPNSICTNGTCICKSGSVFNSNLTACLKVATSYGELCEDTVQCSANLWGGGSCEIEPKSKTFPKPEKTICICGKGYHYLHGRCYRSLGLGDECRLHDECYVTSDFKAASCKNGTCVCSDGFYEREYRTCHRAANAEGEECTIDLDCRFNKNATCVKSKCQLDGKSKLLLLQNIEKVYVKQDRTSDLGNVCETDKECRSNNTICGPESKCICKRAYFNSFGECVPELGEPCLETDSTKNNFFICRNGVWSCEAGKVASKNNQICRKVTKVINNSCVYDEQCYVFGPDAFCKNKKCFCNDNSHYVEEELFCWKNKGIKESCKSNKDCHINGSENALACTNSICSCPKGTLPNSEKTLCIKIGIGTTCNKTEDCIVNNGDCISNICNCIKNYTSLSEDNCVEISSYGNKCYYDIQCNVTLTNGTCSRSKDTAKGKNSTSGICTCAHNYHYNNGNCFVKKFLGDSCQNESECYLDKDIDRVKCTNGICSCSHDYTKMNNRTCAKSGSTAIYLPIWIGLMAVICKLLML